MCGMDHMGGMTQTQTESELHHIVAEHQLLRYKMSLGKHNRIEVGRNFEDEPKFSGDLFDKPWHSRVTEEIETGPH